jgi:glutaryl-CoA dehydrogenase
LGEGGFGPYIPEEYGGAGLDQISYGLIMQEIERGDSGVRSTSSVQSSLVVSYLEIRKRRTTHEIFTKVGYW